MILKQINGNELNLNLSEKFKNHDSKSENFSKVIVEQINNGLYDEISKDLNSDCLVLDLGANVGLFSLFVSSLVKKVIAVEPTPNHLDVFFNLIETFNIQNIEVVKGAVYVKDEPVSFNVYDFNTTMNSIVGNSSFINFLLVQGYTLETILKEHQLIDFCKIDIEGYENFLLKDEKSLTTLKDKVKKIFIEFHDFNGQGFEKLINEAAFNLNDKFKITRLNHDSILCVK